MPEMQCAHSPERPGEGMAATVAHEMPTANEQVQYSHSGNQCGTHSGTRRTSQLLSDLLLSLLRWWQSGIEDSEEILIKKNKMKK